jgi:hypothetical protein
MVKNVVSFLFVTVDKNYTTSGIKLMIEINDYGKKYSYLVKVYSIYAQARS